MPQPAWEDFGADTPVTDTAKEPAWESFGATTEAPKAAWEDFGAPKTDEPVWAKGHLVGQERFTKKVEGNDAEITPEAEKQHAQIQSLLYAGAKEGVPKDQVIGYIRNQFPDTFSSDPSSSLGWYYDNYKTNPNTPTAIDFRTTTHVDPGIIVNGDKPAADVALRAQTAQNAYDTGVAAAKGIGQLGDAGAGWISKASDALGISDGLHDKISQMREEDAQKWDEKKYDPNNKVTDFIGQNVAQGALLGPLLGRLAPFEEGVGKAVINPAIEGGAFGAVNSGGDNVIADTAEMATLGAGLGTLFHLKNSSEVPTRTFDYNPGVIEVGEARTSGEARAPYETNVTEKTNKVRGKKAAAISDEVANVTEGWADKPDHLVYTTKKAFEKANPQMWDQLKQDGKTGVSGFTDADGTVHIIAQNVKSMEDVAPLIYHEALGHYGLKLGKEDIETSFNKDIDAVLEDISRTNYKVRQLAEQIQAKEPETYTGPDAKARYVEEALSKMSEGGPIQPTVRSKLSSVLRRWGDRAGLKDIRYTDNVVKQILAENHARVINGNKSGVSETTGNRYMSGADNDNASKKDISQEIKDLEDAGASPDLMKDILFTDISHVPKEIADNAHKLTTTQIEDVLERLDRGERPKLSDYIKDPGNRYMSSSSEDSVKPERDVVANLSRKALNSSTDIEDRIRGTHAELEAEGRTPAKTTHSDVKTAAKLLGLKPAALLKKNPELLDTAVLHRARELLVETSQKAVDLADKFASGKTTMSAFRKAALQQVAVQEWITKAANTAGRALNTLGIKLEGEEFNKFLGEMDLDRFNDVRYMAELAERIKENKDNPDAVNKALRDSTKNYLPEDWLTSYHYAAMLSGYHSLEHNFVGHLAGSFLNNVAKGTSATIGSVGKRLPGLSDKDWYSLSDFRSRLFGYAHVIADGGIYQKTVESFKQNKIVGDSNSQGTWSGGPKLPGVLTAPERLHTASYTFFGEMELAANLYEKAARIARSEGKTGAELSDRIEELAHNPSREMFKAAQKDANSTRFMGEGDLQKWLRGRSKEGPLPRLFDFALKNIAPFAGIAEQKVLASARFVPILDRIDPLVREQSKTFQGRQMMAARYMMGATALTYAYENADKIDAFVKKHPSLAGEIPLLNMIVLGRAAVLKYRSLRRESDVGTAQAATEAVFKSLVTFASAMRDETFAKGLGDFFVSLHQGGKPLDLWIARQAQSWMPYSAAAREITKIADPVKRDITGDTTSETVANGIKSLIPKYSKELPEKAPPAQPREYSPEVVEGLRQDLATWRNAPEWKHMNAKEKGEIKQRLSRYWHDKDRKKR